MCGSIAGINGSRDLLQAAHVAVKGAVMALTRQLAAEGAAHGIRVNSVSPGLIATPTIRQILTDVPEMLISMVNRAYNHRPGNAEEVAAAALFLVSDESSYLSGANLVVDGGTTVLI
jgi:NAD(P)-dependent dehydrogenase (short-subunit alcohol dehydrogenase family)